MSKMKLYLFFTLFWALAYAAPNSLSSNSTSSSLPSTPDARFLPAVFDVDLKKDKNPYKYFKQFHFQIKDEAETISKQIVEVDDVDSLVKAQIWTTWFDVSKGYYIYFYITELLCTLGHPDEYGCHIPKRRVYCYLTVNYERGGKATWNKLNYDYKK